MEAFERAAVGPVVDNPEIDCCEFSAHLTLPKREPKFWRQLFRVKHCHELRTTRRRCDLEFCGSILLLMVTTLATPIASFVGEMGLALFQPGNTRS